MGDGGMVRVPGMDGWVMGVVRMPGKRWMGDGGMVRMSGMGWMGLWVLLGMLRY